jgi:hypothetical protein
VRAWRRVLGSGSPRRALLLPGRGAAGSRNVSQPRRGAGPAPSLAPTTPRPPPPLRRAGLPPSELAALFHELQIRYRGAELSQLQMLADHLLKEFREAELPFNNILATEAPEKVRARCWGAVAETAGGRAAGRGWGRALLPWRCWGAGSGRLCVLLLTLRPPPPPPQAAAVPFAELPAPLAEALTGFVGSRSLQAQADMVRGPRSTRPPAAPPRPACLPSLPAPPMLMLAPAHARPRPRPRRW